MKTFFTVIFFIVFLPLIVLSSIIHVPGNQPSIQAGINAAVDGDIVLVADSTYYENINFKGKAITVASHFWMDGDTSHISATIIDGSQHSHPDSGSVVYFGSGEDTTSVLYGLTITGGTGTVAFAGGPNLARVGGGIFINNSNAKILHNYIFNNTVADSFGVIGGGLTVFPPFSTTFVIVEDNTFDSNFCVRSNFVSEGGGMFITNRARICNNIFSNNFVSSDSGEAFGGGFTVAFSMDYILIYNNLIIHNKVETNYITDPLLDGALGGGFVLWDDNTSAFIRMIGNTIAHNEVSGHNYIDGAGGFIEDTKGDVLFANNIIHNNFFSGSVECQGTGLRMIRSKVNIINNTIADNEPSQNGGALSTHNDDSSLFLNNILWGNSDGITKYEIDIVIGNPPIFNFCDVQGGWAGTGNINADLLFLDSAYHLSPGSPCIDTGHPDPIYNDPEDPNNPGYALLPAMGGLRNDMGAYGGPGSSEIIDGIIDIENTNQPFQYLLKQNYPNPFNPTTNIEFSIPKTEFVTLKIYNLLGQEVSTLVSDKLTPDNYKYTWDASGFASGIYYYKMEAGSYIQTKKLIIIK